MTLTLLEAVASTSASAVRPTLTDRKLFTLVYVGDTTPRPASDDEAAALGRALACELALPVPAACSAAGHPASCTHAESSPTQHTPRPAGPCLHCGATESPQWRKGPASKPVLCNACGTRYRRTSQLSVGRPVLGPARTGQARKRCAEQGAHNTQGVKSARQAYVV